MQEKYASETNVYKSSRESILPDPGNPAPLMLALHSDIHFLTNTTPYIQEAGYFVWPAPDSR